MSRNTSPAGPHVVITPTRDEGRHLPDLIAALAAQRTPPDEWIVVDECSQDETADILANAARAHPWIRVLEVPRTPRARGGKIARHFLTGLASARPDWAFASKIDADLVPPRDYFEGLNARFQAEERLGIAGGACYLRRDDRLEIERVSAASTRGGLRTWRRACHDAIGGIRPVDGWDSIDLIMARLGGWQTRVFPELIAVHHRATGSYSGVLQGQYTAGRFSHFIGYHPLHMLARCARQTFDRPYALGGLAMAAGYLRAAATRQPVFDEPGFTEALRGMQLARWRALGRSLRLFGASRER